MSIRRYFKPVSGLPDPRGRLSQSIPPAAIAEANRLVQEAAQQSSAKSTSTKRRPYKTYHPADRLKIAKYACDHGVAAAARFFSKKLKDTISESTVRSIRDSYSYPRTQSSLSYFTVAISVHVPRESRERIDHNQIFVCTKYEAKNFRGYKFSWVTCPTKISIHEN